MKWIWGAVNTWHASFARVTLLFCVRRIGNPDMQMGPLFESINNPGYMQATCSKAFDLTHT